jgi:hypothetical protein
VSIHTPAYAAYEIIHAVSKRMNPNRRDLLFDTALVKDERGAEIITARLEEAVASSWATDAALRAEHLTRRRRVLGLLHAEAFTRQHDLKQRADFVISQQ